RSSSASAHTSAPGSRPAWSESYPSSRRRSSGEATRRGSAWRTPPAQAARSAARSRSSPRSSTTSTGICASASAWTPATSSRPALVARLDLDLAERQRRGDHPHGAEAAAPRLGLPQEIEVDPDLVDVLHAADVRVPELLIRVEERAGLLDAGGRVDDLVAVHFAAAAFDLVLRAQRELARTRGRLLAHLHTGIVGSI